jgi:predicted ATPase
MLKSIHLKNFKSIKEQKLELAPITVLVGPNGCGKSSVLQALGVLKGFVQNPSRGLNDLFNLHFVNLGSFKDVVYTHNESSNIEIAVETINESANLEFILQLGKQSATTIKWKKPFEHEMQALIALPWSPKPDRKPFTYSGKKLTFVWDGLNAVVEPKTVELSDIINLHKSESQNMHILLSRRGFHSPIYQRQKPSLPITLAVTEAQVASLLEDADIEEMVMTWTEEVFGVQVRAKVTPPNITLVTRSRRFAPKIVNEGLGLNQTTYVLSILATAKEGSLIAIEEPEISLHPKAQSKLANIFTEVAAMKKRILFTTHSEHIVIALLTLVAKGKLPPEDLSIYSFEKAAYTSKAKKLKINEKGQVEGGIKDFFEHELSSSIEYLKALAQGSK